MKKPRWTRWRWLLALLLGVGTWWGVGWWLSPRVWFEAEYPLEVAGMAIKRDLPGKDTDLAPSTTSARLWDREGKYLFVEQPEQQDRNRFRLIDLASLQTAAEGFLPFTLPLKPNDITRLEIKSQPHLANPNGVKQFPIMRWRGDPADVVSALWEWSPFTNTVRCCRQFPRADKLIISHDGSTMVEIERYTPLLPTLMLALNISNTLAGLAEANLKITELKVFRVWALPEVTLNATITLSNLECDNWNAVLTRDGTNLVFTAATLPSGFTSSMSYETRDYPNPGKNTHYIHAPASIRVYDTKSGRLTWQKADYEAWYRDNGNLYTNDTLHFYCDGRPVVFHLPSKSLIPGKCCKSSARLNQHESHLADWDARPTTLFVLTDDGTIKQSNYVLETGDYPDVIPYASQIVFSRRTQRSDALPDWLSSFLWEREWGRAWLDEQLEKMYVVDYEKARILWSQRVLPESETTYELTDRW